MIEFLRWYCGIDGTRTPQELAAFRRGHAKWRRWPHWNTYDWLQVPGTTLPAFAVATGKWLAGIAAFFLLMALYLASASRFWHQQFRAQVRTRSDLWPGQ